MTVTVLVSLNYHKFPLRFLTHFKAFMVILRVALGTQTCFWSLSFKTADKLKLDPVNMSNTAENLKCSYV